MTPELSTGTTDSGLQHIELSLKKISEKSDDTLQAFPWSSACTSGCFSSASSIDVKSGDLSALDEMQLDAVIRMSEKALDLSDEDSSWASLQSPGTSVRQ